MVAGVSQENLAYRDLRVKRAIVEKMVIQVRLEPKEKRANKDTMESMAPKEQRVSLVLV